MNYRKKLEEAAVALNSYVGTYKYQHMETAREL